MEEGVNHGAAKKSAGIDLAGPRSGGRSLGGEILGSEPCEPGRHCAVQIRIAVEKLHEMDDAFRKQLGSMLIAHQEELLQLANEKEKQIEAANEKVYCVEEEMRQLLQEMANHKKAMENKIRRLTHALNDFQQDL